MNLIAAISGGPAPISQPFGQTAWSRGAGRAMYEYGRQFCLASGTHTGIDVGGTLGQTLYAPVAGRVLIAGGTPYFTDSRYGSRAGTGQLKLEIAGGKHLIIGHMASMTVRVGQTVQPGQAIGTMGTNNGPHYHVELRVPDRGCAAGMRILDPMMITADDSARTAPDPVPLPTDPIGAIDTGQTIGGWSGSEITANLAAIGQRVIVVIIGCVILAAGLRRLGDDLL